MDQSGEARKRQTRFSLSQETVTILTVGVALAGLILVSQGDMRAEARAGRAEARADRADARADREAMRAEARADRKELRTEAHADREAFAKQITRLVEQQGTLSGLVEGLRHPIASPEG